MRFAQKVCRESGRERERETLNKSSHPPSPPSKAKVCWQPAARVHLTCTSLWEERNTHTHTHTHSLAYLSCTDSNMIISTFTFGINAHTESRVFSALIQKVFLCGGRFLTDVIHFIGFVFKIREQIWSFINEKIWFGLNGSLFCHKRNQLFISLLGLFFSNDFLNFFSEIVFFLQFQVYSIQYN